MLTSALKLVSRGWSVFPCRPAQKVPATKHGCKDATRDPAQITAWWTANPDANIGIATGQPSGIWVLDVDGDEGAETLVELSGGRWPATLTQETPSGGYHLAFRHPGNLGNTARKLGPGLDTRGDGGYIVAAPSSTEAGRYEWTRELTPAPIPGWLIRLARTAPAPRQPLAPSRYNGSRYVEVALDNETSALAGMAPRTGRNHALNRAAFNLGSLVASHMLDEATVYNRLLAAAETCGLLADDGLRRCRATIASGLSAGLRSPREVAS